MKEVVRDYLAWEAVLKEARHLNLDTLQREDAQSNLNLAKENFSMKVSQVYCKIFVPERSENGDLNRPMQVERIECTNGNNISAALDKFISDEKLLSSLGCEELRRLLDKFLWRETDAVKLNRLWECFATYYYLPRLLDVNVLLNTVRNGVASAIFALAEDFQDGKYTELQFGDIACGQISLENFLVKMEVAQKQLDLDKPEPTIDSSDKNHTDDSDDSDDSTPQLSPDTEPPKPEVPTHFSMDVELDNVRYSKELKKYIDEIASYLMNLPGAETSIHVAINISIPEGIPQDLKEIVTANCLDLRIGAENFHFES